VDLRKKLYYRALLFHQQQMTSGNAFQQLFGKYMHAICGDDFTQVRPAGSRGDGGCDGYRHSTQTVYQCYGKNASAGVDSADIVKKIIADFAKAKANFGNMMREWRFVHNIADGFPHEAVQTIEHIRKANPSVAIGLLGPQGIETDLFRLPEAALDDLLGAPGDLTAPLNPSDVQRLLKDMVKQPIQRAVPDFRPVPQDKLERNKLSDAAARVIRANEQFAQQVGVFIRQDSDPQFGDRVASALSEKYLALRSQVVTPDDVLDRLVAFVVGDRLDANISDIAAACAIVAYFFETCDIFDRTDAK
jgi:hypothetical protein